VDTKTQTRTLFVVGTLMTQYRLCIYINHSLWQVNMLANQNPSDHSGEEVLENSPWRTNACWL